MIDCRGGGIREKEGGSLYFSRTWELPSTGPLRAARMLAAGYPAEMVPGRAGVSPG